MADVMRIKPKKTYEWGQDKKFIFVQVPIPAHTTVKKLDIYVSDLILKVTNLEKKQSQIIDLWGKVDYRSHESKFVVETGLLRATLKKEQPDQEWPSLCFEDASLAEMKARRKESELRLEEDNKNRQEAKEKMRVEYDRKATQQLMNFQQKERDKLEEKKQKERDQEVRRVFSGIDQKTGKIQRRQWDAEGQRALQQIEESQENEKKEQAIRKKKANEQRIIQQITKKHQQVEATVQNNSMFTQQDVSRFDELREQVNQGIEMQQIPVRKAENKQVKFTERMYKNLAARDRFIKEPPMPRPAGAASGGDLENKNPLWLKDKGDSFYRDKNYVSAIQAYSEAIKLDSKFIKVYLNRSVAFLKVFRLNEALSDCEQCQLLLGTQLSGGPEEEAEARLTLAKVKVRKAICLAWKGDLAAAEKQIGQVMELEVDSDIKSQVQSCRDLIQNRQASVALKTRGDQLTKVNSHEAAIAHYDTSIRKDSNQYAFSNKILCLNKLGRFAQAISVADIVIKQLQGFNLGAAGQDEKHSVILLKLYYRKAKAHDELGQAVEAEECIRRGLTICSNDRDLQDFLKSIKKKQNKVQAKGLKQASVQLIKEGKVKQALENHSKCLKLLEEQDDVFEYLAILQNQCVCYQKLQKFDDVLSICIRILKIVSGLESKILVFGGKKQTPIDKQQLKKISVRTLLRRANAYTKTSQYYNAKADLEKAYEISADQQVKRQLDNLKQKLQQA